MLRARIVGSGAYLPARVVTNDDLARIVDTSDAWIVERTGIRERRVAADGELTSDLARAAASAALANAGLGPERVDLIVVATSTPDHTFPACAMAVQRKLGAVRAVGFDLQAVCSGFIFALSVADKFLVTGQAKTALVIGAETFSRLLDWQDRTTCVLFGDGAGALVLRAETGTGTTFDRGILATHLGSDGRHYEDLYVDGGPSSTGTTGHLRMHGREVFRHAVHTLTAASQRVLETADLTIDDIDWLVPHQANRRILDAVARRLGIAEERVLVTVDRHANTSAASIPLALAEAAAAGRLQSEQLLVMNAMGGGFTWGAALARW
ncbi:MAG TPA: beta-ketoacyl-ACP synthase III [Geminicoccaceae bacterium]|jgi:3-oxoacyl-[acyl-carrier-protein] synthase-3|nr:beta-ketoacyl-ACP synthase III [Geminicoccaceae bacterium]